jgi:regulator of sirC expression with transglutaminase-like and TPR domain
MRELTAITARAERTMLAAQRGGVLVEDARLAVDHAVDAQIQQEVLVHTFSAAEGSKFMATHEEGLTQARKALEEARGAIDELAFRRRGLAVTLGAIVLVLIGLALKIRQLGAP